LVPDEAVLEEAFDTLRLGLQRRHVLGRSSLQFVFRSHRHLASNHVLQICIQPLLGVQFRAVTGQVEDLHQRLVVCHPSLHGLAVVNPQVVQNQEDFFARVFDQRLEEFNQPLVIERAVDDHPARLALVGHAGDHR